MRVEVDADIEISAKTVREPENLAIAMPQDHYPESAVRVSKAIVAHSHVAEAVAHVISVDTRMVGPAKSTVRTPVSLSASLLPGSR
jgi:hypothetical protein